MPQVSFVISVHNGENFLENCIDSVLNQTFEDFECIILNNGSTDKTQEILEQYTDSRFKIICQENIGVSRSLNKGIHIAKGSLIARLDVDDISSVDRLEKQVGFMTKNPRVVLCGSRFRELIKDKSLPQKVAFIEKDASIRKSMSLFNPFAHSTVMFRKKTFIDSGGYSDKYKNGLDYELWLRMLALGEAQILDYELCLIRFTEQSFSYRNKRRQKMEGILIRWNAFKKFGGNPTEALYYLTKSLVGLAFPSINYFKR
ncbi:MAG TPA: glycosyltransferase [Nitrospina sp.]|nr:glycosyltransferase [Nitrospina sp.]